MVVPLLIFSLLMTVIACNQETPKNDADTPTGDDAAVIDDNDVAGSDIVSDDTVLVPDTDADADTIDPNCPPIKQLFFCKLGLRVIFST